MRKFCVFIILFSFTVVSHAQEISSDEHPYILESSIRTNLTYSSKVGLGIRISGGYNISKNFSILISTGYMSSFADKRSYVSDAHYDFESKQYIKTTRFESEREFQMIPLDLSLKYSFPVFGIRTYLLVRGGWDFMFNYGDYDINIVKKKESTNEILETKSGKATDLPDSINEFGLGLGGGILVSLYENLNLDISYLLFTNSLYPNIHSIAAGINYGL